VNTTPAPTNPVIGAIYLNNGTANPFSGVSAVDIPAPPQSGYGRSIAAGVLVRNGVPDILVAGEGANAAAYYPATLDQNPLAQNDTAVVAINQSVAINVLGNDTPGPGQSLDSSSIAVTTLPQHGTAVIGAGGVVTYQPNTGYSGADTFQYTVRDGLGATSNAASVTVTIQPAPVATNDTANLTENQSATINVLANDTSSGGTLNAASIQIVVPPTHGTAAVSNGAVTYAPASGYSGLDTFQYSVQDNLGTVSNVATVSMEIAAPAAAPPAKGGGGAVSLLMLLVLAGVVVRSSLRRV
jgi:hypothetical protein